MKVGDLIKLIDDSDTCYSGHWCGCWFCTNNSSRIGVVIKRLGPSLAQGHFAPSAARKWGGYWAVMFDAGEWRLYGAEAEVINESR